MSLLIFYIILSLSSKALEVPEGTHIAFSQEASILLEADPANGAYKQATWVEEEENYPKISEEEAIAKAYNYFNNQPYLRKSTFYRNIITRESSNKVKNIRLVWSRSFGTSRFHPSYEISFCDGKAVYVHPDGRVQLIKNMIIPVPSIERLTK